MPKILDRKMKFLIGFIVLLYILMASLGPPSSLDIRPYYTGREARSLLKSFSAQDLTAYFRIELLDLLLIASYTSLFVIGLKRKYPDKKWILVLPLIAGGADIVENISIISVLKFSVSEAVFDWLGIFTFVKWSVGAATFFLLVKRRKVEASLR